MTDKKKLAPKQKRVLDLLNKGKSPTETAKALGISVNGIYGHMRRIEAKGYAVPRSTNGRSASRKTRTKASPNGSGPIDKIDSGIARLIEQAEDRAKEIEVEAMATNERLVALTAEAEELAKRRKALAAARG